MCRYEVEESHIESFGKKVEGRNPLGRTKNKWQNNIKIDLQEMVCGNTDWIDLARDR
jgi:hypothetical protein